VAAGGGALTLRAIKPATDTKSALEVLDVLREQVLSGQVIAFVAAAIEPDDTTTRFQATTRPVTKLRMLGAVASLNHWVHDDE
jgi:hypothetical protein